MKRFVILISLLSCAVPAFAQKAQTLSDAVQTLAAQFKQGMEKENRKRVGITGFTDVHSSARTVFGSYLAEAITTRMVVAGFDVVERPQMDKVIAALGREASRAIDQDTAKKAGHQAGVEAIVIGSLTDLGYAIEINARVIDIATGRVLTASTVLVTRDTMVTAMVGPQTKKEEVKPVKPKPPEEDGVLAWTMSGTRVVVDGALYNGTSIVLALAFENDGDEERTVRPKRISLVDENGDRYRYYSDTEDFVDKGVTIAPGTRARSNFWFLCSGACNGTKVTLLDSNSKVILRNVPVTR